MNKIIVILLFIFVMLVILWNCNGLCNVDKMKMIFSLFVEKKYDIIGL